MNYSPTIRWDYKKFKKVIRSTSNTTSEVLQFAYAEVVFDFLEILLFLFSTIFYILAPRRQMGDFGRQNSLWHENLVNLLQFLFQQYGWSELEVLVFPKRSVFTE